MKWFVILSILLAFVWLLSLLAHLEARDYPRRTYHQRSDDGAAAILLTVFIVVGVLVLVL